MAQDWFVSSAFSNVASEESARCWAGRATVKVALDRLRKSLTRMPESTLDLMWANLGAGKTHTLLHLQATLSSEDASMIVGFVEMPEQVATFLDLYRRIIAALPLEAIGQAVLSSKEPKNSSVYRASNVFVNGGPDEREIVSEWFRGGRPTLPKLRQCSGISERIESDTVAADVLCSICSALASKNVRLVLLIDEYQRVGVLKPQARDRVLSSLRTVFSRSPKYLSAVLSVHSMVEQNALRLVPPELQTLIGRRPTISLPAMDVTDAEEFILGRFSCFRPAGFSGTKWAPFAPDAIAGVLEVMAGKSDGVFTPRELLQTFGYIYGQADDPSLGISKTEAIGLTNTLFTDA